ncbi:MAG: hypothetical protein ACHQEM_03140 [Chitinophagales bacterium]
MRFFPSLLNFLFPLISTAGNLDGIWKGELTQDPGGCYPRYTVEFQFHFSGNDVSGKVYDYYDTSKFVKLSFTGKYDPAANRLVLIENKVLQFNIPPDCVPCIKTYELTYTLNGQEETLSGEWKGHIVSRQRSCPPGKIVLKRVFKSDFPADLEQSDSLALIQESLHLQPRVKDVVQSFVVAVSQIKVELYDNAEIDNDTITVFVNDKLMLYQKRLTEKPLTLLFNAYPDKEYELVMYADNLGLIPPNTALMVVTAGKKKFEVFLSSSEQKSAAVRFVYKKPD